MSSESSLQNLSSSDKRALLARLLAEEACGPVRFPLSSSQQRLWFLDQLDSGKAVYSLNLAFGLRGELSWRALEASVQEIVRRHGTLRTTFETVDHQPVQVVSPAGAACVSLADLGGLPVAVRRH